MFEVKNNIFEMEIMMSIRIIIDSASDLTKEQADKLGLGLALVHEIVRVHDGTIQVKDNPTGGTIFEVIF